MCCTLVYVDRGTARIALWGGDGGGGGVSGGGIDGVGHLGVCHNFHFLYPAIDLREI